ncbi:hypothetical protein JXA88_04495 [Candidatus Fermentibacteria bacterium]|nr:hypothetical protein [Candidatus Fermentibacteria bacterium]
MDHDGFKGVIIVKDGVQKKVSFDELCLSNTMSLEALVSLLVKKKIIKPEELLDAIRSIKSERYRTGSPPEEP